MTDQEIISAILAREGGYTDIPADRGGATNYGITLATLAQAWERDVSVLDLQHLTEAQARDIYQSLYIERPGFRAIANPSLRALVVDTGVHCGPQRATKWLQQALGVEPDGVIGEQTTAALAGLTPAKALAVYLDLVGSRVRHYGRLITTDHTQAVFAAGWMARAAEFLESAPVQSIA